MQSGLSPEFISECRGRLLSIRTDLLNRIRLARLDLESVQTHVGDEADQTANLMSEHTILAAHDRWQDQLLEIDLALARIENGSFGVCEETEEPIEVERLRALPWTRLSIEGAEIREAVRRRFVQPF